MGVDGVMVDSARRPCALIGGSIFLLWGRVSEDISSTCVDYMFSGWG